jgi:hypothetical protein
VNLQALKKCIRFNQRNEVEEKVFDILQRIMNNQTVAAFDVDDGINEKKSIHECYEKKKTRMTRKFCTFDDRTKFRIYQLV